MPSLGDLIARWGYVGIFLVVGGGNFGLPVPEETVLVVAARFIPGLRFLAGPIAGASRMGRVRFAVANLLGAVLYVPYAVGTAVATGYGPGGYVEHLRRAVGDVEKLGLGAAVAAVAATMGWRARRWRRDRRRPTRPRS